MRNKEVEVYFHSVWKRAAYLGYEDLEGDDYRQQRAGGNPRIVYNILLDGHIQMEGVHHTRVRIIKKPKEPTYRGI
jgi:hypothetical protein